MLQRNVAGKIRERRKEYRSWNWKVKELMKENKLWVDEKFWRKVSEKFIEYKLFWKEVHRQRGSVGGECVRVKRERDDGVLMSSKNIQQLSRQSC